MSKPHVIIIGAGFTGVATAHDLALRGCQVTVVERGDICNGTSGRTHGLLHSGGRYAVKDKESAIECIEENQILRRIVPQVIEPNGGLFIALDDSDLSYAEQFIAGCEECGIPLEELTPQQALTLEPNLNPRLLAAFLIPDATFDPLRLALAFAATARHNGAQFRTYAEVETLLMDGQGNVTGVRILDRAANRHEDLHADMVVNATGAWAGQITAMAGLDAPVHPTPGIMVAYDQRLVQRAVNRLNEPGDGDIVLPQRRMVVVGTTSFTAENVDYIPVTEDQVQLMLERGSELIPAIRNARPRGIYMATRPLVGSGSGRSMARTFKCFDHKETHNIEGLVTITGGKATTMRAMAEKTADVVCAKLGIQTPCTTRETPLLSYRQYYTLSNQEKHYA
ncbi:MAG: FAD-dependent oxidoreductase [Anaerolineales bacterium]|nr:FAD-dependent oxidoreductase [Anaerolineales bacterium]MCX7754611.1 FAD-dependent oxidoreductase [Anaerolineales bacterium]MDW8278108.1 FAD-dependent oxidoreductase [Anaerolineales bacterium]